MSVIKVTKESFKEEVLKSKKKVLVDFNATWCGPCRMLGPIIEELSKEKEEVVFASVNVDEEEDLAREYNVNAIPCLVVMQDGKEQKRSIGLISKEDLKDLLKD